MKFNLQESITLLSRTPHVIDGLLRGLPEAWVRTNEGGDTWSPYDIIGHLIYGEKTDWIPRTKIILGDAEDKTFIPFNRFAQFEESKGKSMEYLLDEFLQLRRENLEALEAMQIDDHKLQMTGIHPDLGVVTLAQLLSTWTIHDLSHINQMTRVMMKNYTLEVGPWIAYNTLLR